MSEPMSERRRALLRDIALLSGASAMGIGPALLAQAVETPAWFLSDQHRDTLSAYADTLIPHTDTPGALGAGLPARFDALMTNWASPLTRERIIGALSRLDDSAQDLTGESFAELSAQQRHQVLVAHDQAALQPAPAPADAPPPSPMSRPYVVDNGYQQLKGLLVDLYYVSEIGMTQELVYEHVPGAWVPSMTITPGMRPFASLGMF